MRFSDKIPEKFNPNPSLENFRASSGFAGVNSAREPYRSVLDIREEGKRSPELTPAMLDGTMMLSNDGFGFKIHPYKGGIP